jgi:putative NADH-flavin reductase
MYERNYSFREIKGGCMKVLFIGGTGIISTAVSRLAVERGIELFHLNRGLRKDRMTPGVTTLVADVHQPGQVEAVLAGHTFDSVVDWIAFRPAGYRA